MVKFSPEHKENNQFFKEGKHKVKIEDVVFGLTDDGKEYAEFSVVDPEISEKKDKARVWFTTDKAIRFSFSIIRGIFTANCPEDKKDELAEKLQALEDTEALAKVCVSLRGKNAWFTLHKSDRTYTNDRGEVKNSYDRGVWGFEPDEPKSSTDSTTPDTVSTVQKETGGEKVEVGDEFPF